VAGTESLVVRFEVTIEAKSGLRGAARSTIVALAARPKGGTIDVDRIGAGTDSRIGSGPSSDATGGAAAGPVESLRRPRTCTYALSGNASINSRRRRISNSPFGDAPVVSSSCFSCATTSASVKARAPNVLMTFSNTEVRTTGFDLAGPSVRSTGEVIDADRAGAGPESAV
jgi:hypothetical protein